MGDLLASERSANGADFAVLSLGPWCAAGDDLWVMSGIVYVIGNGLQWKDAPMDEGPHKTLYNCFIRWSRFGFFDRIFAGLAAEGRSLAGDGSSVAQSAPSGVTGTVEALTAP